ncbi:MAG: ACT domain-containing protein, partial [Phycisphaerae bacterium]
LVDDIVQNVYDDGKLANLGFATNESDAHAAGDICRRIASELGIGTVHVDFGVSKVSAIGVGMRTHAGIASTMFQALSDAQVNIENISTSEIVISCIVRREDAPKALRFVHNAFGLDKPDPNGHGAP